MGNGLWVLASLSLLSNAHTLLLQGVTGVRVWDTLRGRRPGPYPSQSSSSEHVRARQGRQLTAVLRWLRGHQAHLLCEATRGQPAGWLPGAATGTEELPVFTTSCTALVPTVPTSAQRVPWLTLYIQFILQYFDLHGRTQQFWDGTGKRARHVT